MTAGNGGSATSTDLIIVGGTVVLPQAVERCDILVSVGTIAKLGPPGSIRRAGRRVLDAANLLVLPGFVDAHVHLREPGLTEKEDIASATRAAAAGGITSIMAMPFDVPPATTGPIVTSNAALIEGRAHVDVAMLGAAGPHNISDLTGLARAGARSFEVMMSDAPPAVDIPDESELEAILRVAHGLGVVVGIYCEDPQLVASARAIAQQRGQRDLAAFTGARSPAGEVAGVLVATRLAARTGAAIHLRQLSLADSLVLAQSARRAGTNVTTEVTPHHLSLTAEDAQAGKLQVLPPLRTPGDVAALRAGVRDGLVDIVASDHAPHAPLEKLRGREDAWAAPSGLPGLETLVPVMFETFGAEEASTIATVCATNPARRFGLRRKGRIEVGADGDFAMIDPNASWTVDPGRLHSHGATPPFAGHRFASSVRSTVLRGVVIATDREVASRPTGRWIR